MEGILSTCRGSDSSQSSRIWHIDVARAGERIGRKNRVVVIARCLDRVRRRYGSILVICDDGHVLLVLHAGSSLQSLEAIACVEVGSRFIVVKISRRR
jgi:hypothetical protein